MLVAACGQQTPSPAGAKKAGRTAVADESRAKVSELAQPELQFLDHSLLGSDLKPDGTVAAEKDFFTEGQPIYLTMYLRESPPGLQTSAVWTNENKKTLKIERKEMNGGKVATFAFHDPKMKAGHYRVVGYWGGNIASEREFVVQAPAKAAPAKPAARKKR